ncbi:hypothetical protein OGAPHI_002655 [Ogataea philodendri]|uniref:Peroxisomal-coenzyme A synthetase n=1 Tax=Ogataea philodendri TaxID=1378263 RepID=A0A9P8T872_9ASCO|nr:uncharacterized protein OGAPHI_002655 [Ogataea philodendri]KAH3668900.1 hypothetical protein OGAPHI_002655 [Ogataea philodendri]
MSIQSSLKISDKTALILPDDDLCVSYEHLNGLVHHLHSLFTNSVSPLYNKGSNSQLKVAICLPNGLDFVVSFLAITTTGNVAAPFDPHSAQAELTAYFSDLEIDAVIVPRYAHLDRNSSPVSAARNINECLVVEVWYDLARQLLQFEIFDPHSLKSIYNSVIDKPALLPPNFKGSMIGTASKDKLALVLFTSGTTGKAKSVPLTQSNLTSSMMNIIESYRLRSRDRNYVIMPLYHIHGLQILMSTLASEGTAIIPDRFHASKFYPHFTKWKFNWYSAVPTIHYILLRGPIPEEIKGKLRFIRSSSSSLSLSIFEQLESKFGCPVVEAYGMTEASHQVTSNNLPFHGKIRRQAGTVGIPQGSVKLLIINDANQTLGQYQTGQVAISGPNVTAGYLNDESANKNSYFNHDGRTYFKTGDLGMLDDNGRLCLKGRLKEVINKGGEKISPLDIETALSNHECVEESVAYAVPDEKYGQTINCAVVLKEGASASANELISWLNDKISAFKIPQKLFLVKQLPKTTTGKIQRNKMAEIFGAKIKV